LWIKFLFFPNFQQKPEKRPPVFRGRVNPYTGISETQVVDNSRLSVDKCLALWRSPPSVEITGQPVPPDMGMAFSHLQYVDLMRKRLNLWKNLWVSSPESLHRARDVLAAEKPNI
jgi:hypothetical protein